jgi:hypothetical protein
MKRFTLVAAAALAALLMAPATSLGGGWATVGLSSLPDGTQAGEEWNVELTVLQHGRTPLEGVEPRVLIRAPGGGEEQVFGAKPTEHAGVYLARVVFPSVGRWTYAVDDDFSQVHELGAVRIGSGGEDAAAGIALTGALGIAIGAGVLAAFLTAALRRRGQARPAEG